MLERGEIAHLRSQSRKSVCRFGTVLRSGARSLTLRSRAVERLQVSAYVLERGEIAHLRVASRRAIAGSRGSSAGRDRSPAFHGSRAIAGSARAASGAEIAHLRAPQQSERLQVRQSCWSGARSLTCVSPSSRAIAGFGTCRQRGRGRSPAFREQKSVCRFGTGLAAGRDRSPALPKQSSDCRFGRRASGAEIAHLRSRAAEPLQAGSALVAGQRSLTLRSRAVERLQVSAFVLERGRDRSPAFPEQKSVCRLRHSCWSGAEIAHLRIPAEERLQVRHSAGSGARSLTCVSRAVRAIAGSAQCW